MKPEAKAVLACQIEAALRRFDLDTMEVTLGKGGRSTAYVIWDRRSYPVQVYASLSRAEARDELVRLQTAAITQIIEETALVCPAD